MKLSLAVGILSSQTLPVLLEARVLSNTKLDSDDPPPRSSSDHHEEPPVLRGRKQLVGSTTTPFKTTTTSLQQHRQQQQHQQQLVSKKAIECIPPSQEESAEADYDLGVLGCATTASSTTADQVCVANDDSSLGGYCMDPPALTYDDTSRKRFLGGIRDAIPCSTKQGNCECVDTNLYKKSCLWFDPVDRDIYVGCYLGFTSFYFSYYYDLSGAPGTLEKTIKTFRFFGDCWDAYRARIAYVQKHLEGLVYASYNGVKCVSLGVDGTFDCNSGVIIDFSKDNPWKDISVS